MNEENRVQTPSVDPGEFAVMSYAGLWSRAVAHLIDMLILFPLGIIFLWAFMNSKTAVTIWSMTGSVLYVAYFVYFHTTCGQTWGKKVCRIRAVNLDGSPMGLREALWRSSVAVILAVMGGIEMFVRLSHVPETAYLEPGLVARFDALTGAYYKVLPVWLIWVGRGSILLSWTDTLTLLLNKKRRTLHDFIAGTVVVHVKTSAPFVGQQGSPVGGGRR